MDVQTQVAIKLQQAIQKAGYVIIHMLIRCIIIMESMHLYNFAGWWL